MLSGHGFLRQLAPSWRAGHGLDYARRLAEFGNRSGGKLTALADYGIRELPQQVRQLGAGLVETAVFGRRNAGGRLEGAIEGPKRLKAGIHRDGDHGHLGLRGVRQSRLGLLDPVIVEEDIEIAITQPLVDQAPQSVFGGILSLVASVPMVMLSCR